MNNLDQILEKQRQVVKKMKEAGSQMELRLLVVEFMTLNLRYEIEAYKQGLMRTGNRFIPCDSHCKKS